MPFEYIRASGAAKAAEVDAAVAGQKRPAAGEGEAKEGAGAFVIPMHLRVLPTDSEEERLRKRKRVKHLKAAAKKKDKGEDDAEQGKNWQDYLNKVSGCHTLFSRPRQHTHDALRTRQCSSYSRTQPHMRSCVVPEQEAKGAWSIAEAEHLCNTRQR